MPATRIIRDGQNFLRWSRQCLADALVKSHARAVVDVDVVHLAAIGADAAAVIFLQPVGNGAILPAGRFEIERAAACVIARSSGPANARASAEG